jgi:hypothetical protein
MMGTRKAKLQRIMCKINDVSSTWTTNPIDCSTWNTNPTKEDLQKWLAFATTMSKLNDVRSIWKTNPTKEDFQEWLAFATQHAPQIRTSQSTISRISATSLMVAAHHGYTVSVEAHLRYDTEPHIRQVYTVTLKNAAKKNKTYLEAVKKHHAWIVDVCTLISELQKLHQQSQEEDMGHFFQMEVYHKCFCELLESLDREYELFHPGVLIDAVLDYDSCASTATLLCESLHKLFSLSNSEW